MSEKQGVSRTSIVIIIVIVAAVTCAVIAMTRIDIHGARGSGLSPEFNYDVTALRKVDPNLIKYTEIESIPTGFQNVYAIAVAPDDRIYVAGDKAIRVFDSAGKESDTRFVIAANCLAVAGDGTVYAGLNDHVVVFDAKGEHRSTWPQPDPKSRVTSIAVSKEDIFVADWGTRTVLRFDRSGRLLARIGEKNGAQNAAGLIVPSPYFDVAVAPDGVVLVADTGRHQIESYSPDGQYRSAWGKFAMEVDGFCGCCNPAHFALLPDGSVVTTEKGLLRVKTYTPQGVFDGVVAAPDLFPAQALECQNDCRTGLTLPVATDSLGRVLVLDPSARAIRIFVRNKEIKLSALSQ